MDILTSRSIFGFDVRLTTPQWNHILERHPEMLGQIEKFGETLSKPDFVLQSKTDQTVQYCKRYESTPVTKKILLIVAKHLDKNSFVITAFFVNRVRAEGKRVLYGEEILDQL